MSKQSIQSSRSPRPRRRRDSINPTLRFSPYAWAKLHWFCHHGGIRNNTEIGGFGITPPEDPLLVIDFVTVKQTVTAVSVEFDDEAVADFFDVQVDAGRTPAEFARTWIHTHPGDSPTPSGLDEETFARCFGGCNWAIMFVLSEGGPVYARLRFNAGPGGDVELPVAVDYRQPFAGSDHEAWDAEYVANVHPKPRRALRRVNPDETDTLASWDEPDDPTAEIEILAALERAEDEELVAWLLDEREPEDADV